MTLISLVWCVAFFLVRGSGGREEGGSGDGFCFGRWRGRGLAVGDVVGVEVTLQLIPFAFDSGCLDVCPGVMQVAGIEAMNASGPMRMVHLGQLVQHMQRTFQALRACRQQLNACRGLRIIRIHSSQGRSVPFDDRASSHHFCPAEAAHGDGRSTTACSGHISSGTPAVYYCRR